MGDSGGAAVDPAMRHVRFSDFNGEPLLLRVLGLGEFLQDRGWRPALRRVRASTLLHRSGGGQQVVTQLWQR